MVELKSKNLFLLKGDGSMYVVPKILDFLDLIGKNIVYFHDEKTPMVSLQRFKTIEFSKKDFPDKLKNNLFRVDIIVIESEKVKDKLYYNRLRKITDLPVLWISHSIESKFTISDFDCIYRLSKNKSNLVGKLLNFNIKENLEDYIVEDLKNGWKSNLKDLRVQYIRDKNLRDLLGDDD